MREKSDLQSKIAETKHANSFFVKEGKEQDWQICLKEAFFENVIPIKLLQKVDQSFFPEFLFKKKTLSAQVSPCDTFNVVSELSGAEKGAFTGSSLPSQKLLKKTIILDRNSFTKNAAKLIDEDRWRAVEFLIGNNFEVYLAVKKEGGTDFMAITSKNAPNLKAANELLNDEDLENFELTEDLFKKLTKLNPQISADGLINPSVEDMFFVAALSHFSSSKNLSPTDLPLESKMGVKDISLINSTLRTKKYKTNLYLIVAAAIVILFIGVRSYQTNRINSLRKKVGNNPEFDNQIIGSMSYYFGLHHASNKSFIDFSGENFFKTKQNASNLLGEIIYDNLIVGDHPQGIQADKTTQGFLNSLSQSLHNNLVINDNWQVRSRSKKGMAYISSQVGDYEIRDENSSSSSFFQMESIGEALNSDGSPINIRTDLENFEINKEGKLFFKPRVETIFKQFVPEVLTESKVNKFKDSYDASYFRFSTDLPANQRTRLFSVSSSEKLVGIIEDSHDLKIEKGKDGFFYATSSSDRKLSYVIRAEEGLLKDNVEELLPTNHPIQKIIDDYSDAKKGFYLSTPKDFALPENKENDIDKWLNEIYETRSGACRYRVAAVYNKIVKTDPSQKDNVRIVGINNNHVVLEVRQDEKSNWLPINLGGSEAEVSYENTYDQKTADDLPFIKIGSVAFVGTILALALKAYKKGLSTKKEDLKKAGKDEDNEDINIENQFSDAKNKEEVGLEKEEEAKKRITELLQSKRKFLKIDQQEKLCELVLVNKRTLLQTDKTQNSANFLIESLSQKGKKVFYLDEPRKIFHKKTLRIDPNQIVKIFNASEFDKFKAQNQENGEDAVIIINWNVFNSQQNVALNNLLDGGDNSIVSLVENIPNDASFLSRHQSLISSDCEFAPNLVSEFLPKAASDSVFSSQKILVDLEGAPDWRQKLFGSIDLVDNQIFWGKSEFCRHLEAAEKSFVVSNISAQAKKDFEKEILEAKSRGFFDYHGHQLPFPQNLEIEFSEKSFDFAKFNNPEQGFVVNVRSNFSDLANLPENAAIVNTNFFDHLLNRNLIENQKYSKISGLIAENKDKELNLFITFELSPQQYYCMLNEALGHKVTLNLYLAPNVSLPNLVATKEIANNPSKLIEEVSQKRPQIFITNNANQIAQEIAQEITKRGDKIYAVIDAEDYNYSDLFDKITYSRSGNSYTGFNQVLSDFATNLNQGEKIILKGDFSDSLLMTMHSILCAKDSKYSAIGDNLILVIEAKEIQQESKKKSLEFLGKNFCKIKNYEDLLPKKSDFDLIENGEKAADLADLQNSKEKARQFIEVRKESVANALEEKSILQIIGHSGVGKSSLLKLLQQENSRYEVYDEMINFKDWAENEGDKTKILFIDESNIENSHLTKFSPLKIFNHDQTNDEKVKILHDQKFYEIGKNHKVVFARNPNNYSDGRNAQKLFDDGVSTVYFRDFPSSYIYEKILHEPIYQLLDESVKSLVCEEDFQRKSQELIAQYQSFNSDKRAQNDEINCETVRELQEKMMLYLNEKIPAKKTSDIQSDRFITTEATKDLEQKLCDAIEIRLKQKAGIFGNLHVGLNGFIIEGEPGIGKSELIGAVLEAKGVIDGNIESDIKSQKYYKISASMTSKEKREAIVRAFEEGNVLWIDEINSCIDDDGLEKTLNAALTGKHPLGKTGSFAAGFLMISSINPPILSGRSQLSPAIKHRSNIYQSKSLNDYELDDLKKISRHCFEVQQRQAQLDQKISTDFDIPAIATKAFYEELQKPDGIKINLRDLRDVLGIFGNYPPKSIEFKDSSNLSSGSVLSKRTPILT